MGSKKQEDEITKKAGDMFASFHRQVESDRQKAAEKKRNHVMRDLDYWITRYINKDLPMPRQFSGYVEEHQAWLQAIAIEDHNKLVERAKPWFVVAAICLIIFVIACFIFGFIVTLAVSLGFAIIALYVFGFAGVTHL